MAPTQPRRGGRLSAVLLRCLPLSLALVGPWGCNGDGFTCADDDQCMLAGHTGQCTLGYCSFSDPECESGQRYGDHAGEFSGRCVAPMDAASSSMSGTTGFEDSSSSASASASASSIGEASTAEPPIPECIDGVECDGTCVDPFSDPFYCGASDDCTGSNSGRACSPSAACMAGECIDSCDNCGFEAGDFDGWTTLDLSDPYVDLAVTSTAGEKDLFLASPTEGRYFAVTGFDGNGPGTIEIGQDITLGSTPARLVFDYRAGWDLLNHGAALERRFEVWLEPPGGGSPNEIVTVLVAPAEDLTPDTGVQTAEIDLDAYADQTIFVRFVFDVPEDYSGPGLAMIDDVRIEAQ